MVCKTCGNQLNPNDKFCRYCGTTVPAAPQQNAAPQSVSQTYTLGHQGAQPPVNNGGYVPGTQNGYVPYAQQNVQGAYSQQPNQNTYARAPQQPNQNTYNRVPQQSNQPKAGKYSAPKAPKQPGKNPLSKLGKKGMIIGGVVAAVVVIALVVLLLVSGNPAVKVASALKNTADEFSKVADVWNAGDASALAKRESLSMDLDVSVNSLDEYIFGMDASVLSGLGIRMQMDVSLEDREMGMEVAPYVGSVDLTTVMIAAEDEMIYFGAPDFFPAKSYGINTVTMMQDLERLGADVGEAAQISFNIFDLMDIVREHTDHAEENQKLLTEASAQLVKELEIEKDGKTNIRIHGTNTKCNVYIVTIPQNALENWFEAVEEISTSVDYMEVMEEVLDGMNLPADIVDELLDEFSYSYSEPDFDGVYDLLDEIGDVELELYVKSNKVAAVKSDLDIDGSELELALFVGGKDRYIDDITLELAVDGEELVVSCSGDHAAKDGVFTTEMTIEVDGEEVVLEVEYDPKSESDNLSMKMGDGYDDFELEGTYLVGKDRVELIVDEFRYVSSGEEYMSLGFRYVLSGYEKRVELSGAKLLSDMTEDDIMEIAESLETNAMNWVMSMAEQHPELMEALFG